MLTRSEALRSTRAKALKQLAFFNAKHLKCLSPKMLNIVRKILFTSLSSVNHNAAGLARFKRCLDVFLLLAEAGILPYWFCRYHDAVDP